MESDDGTSEHHPKSGRNDDEWLMHVHTNTVIIPTALLGIVRRWRTADGSRKAAEEVPSSKGKMDRRKPVRRESWQGPRNDTAWIDRMIRSTVTFPRIW